jgi:hypothetical protein
MFKKFFSNMKNKAMGALLEKQLKNVPAAQREMIMKAVEKNPEIFKKIADEVQALKKSGANEMYATMQVMQKYQSELQQVLSK